MRGKGYEQRGRPNVGRGIVLAGSTPFNGPIKVPPAQPQPRSESGWVGIPRGPEWRRYVQATTEFYSVTSTGKDAIQ